MSTDSWHSRHPRTRLLCTFDIQKYCNIDIVSVAISNSTRMLCEPHREDEQFPQQKNLPPLLPQALYSVIVHDGEHIPVTVSQILLLQFPELWLLHPQMDRRSKPIFRAMAYTFRPVWLHGSTHNIFFLHFTHLERERQANTELRQIYIKKRRTTLEAYSHRRTVGLTHTITWQILQQVQPYRIVSVIVRQKALRLPLILYRLLK